MGSEGINTTELKMLLKKDEVELVDIREPYELEIIRLEQAKAIPMRELETRLDEIDWQKTVVLVCRTDPRSRWAAQRLSALGKDVKYLQGGIEACRRDGDFPGLVIDEKTIETYFK